MKQIIGIILAILAFNSAFAQQQKDKGVFIEPKPGYFQNTILKDVHDFDQSMAPERNDKKFVADLGGLEFPNKLSLYQQEWHFPPVSQGNTNTCWSFSAISFFESEVKRMTGQEIKLSEMYIVYWEYVEKTRRFVRERGNSAFTEGSECNAVMREGMAYGMVPEKAYTGLETGRKFHSHEQMYKELKTYLESVKASNSWNEEEVIATVRAILDDYLGSPPTAVTWNDKSYSPKEFLSNVLKLKLEDYVDILSVMQQPVWQKVEYEVPDNWWHSKEYYNVPLADYMNAIKSAILNHYSLAIGGDVSEPGFSRTLQAAIIPAFDVPNSNIDDNARQFRISNGTTTDDHGMHLVGYAERNGTDWYLIKDSGSGSRNNDVQAAEFGYYFFREDYVKLKMISFTVHKDAVKDLLKKFDSK